MRQFFLAFLEILEILVIVLVSIYVIYTFVAQPFRVQGGSMEPNFHTGNYLLVDEVTYQFREPVRGEVIVLRSPINEGEFFIKRIIGLPGEELVVANNKVLIDGEVLPEGYILGDGVMASTPPFKLGDGEYFVMGDNRLESYDSRGWGPLGEHQIIGLVRLRFWPPGGWGVFEPATT